MRAAGLLTKAMVGTAVMVAALIAAPGAEASSITFTSSGTVGGYAVSGTATFAYTTGNSFFTVTMANTIPDPASIPQMLDGLNFTVVGGSTPTLTGVSASGGAVNCVGDNAAPCPAAAGPAPTNFAWTAPTTSGNTFLSAGDGAFHDYAIISPTYTSASLGNGELGNPGHNPLLVGPVTFTFNGSFTNITGVQLLWGTTGSPTPGVGCPDCGAGQQDFGPVPEPASMLLLGTGLLGVGAATRRRFFPKK